MSKLYKLYYCVNSPWSFGRYQPIRGLYSSIEDFRLKCPLLFGFLAACSIIKIPFFGYHDSEFHGYCSQELRSLAPRVHRSETRRPRK